MFKNIKIKILNNLFIINVFNLNKLIIIVKDKIVNIYK